MDRCDKTEQKDGDTFALNSYRACQSGCYSQRAHYTKNVTDCDPVLALVRNAPADLSGSNSIYSLYFDCIATYAGATDPALCTVVQDGINDIMYPYCIIKIAAATKDVAVCELTKSEADFNDYYFNICMRGVQK